jgi:hypothetical protein
MARRLSMCAAVSTPPSVRALQAASTTPCCSLAPICRVPSPVHHFPRSGDDHHGHRIGLGRGACGFCARVEQRLVATPEAEAVPNVQSQTKVKLDELVLGERTKALHSLGPHLLDCACSGIIAGDWPRSCRSWFGCCGGRGSGLACRAPAGPRRDVIRGRPRLPASECHPEDNQGDALYMSPHCPTAAM